MQHYQFRYGTAADKSWLYDLYCETMKPYIEATWGWNESFQLQVFGNNLEPTRWQIVNDGQHDVGGFVLKEEADHFCLEMIIITPTYQKNGIGRVIVNLIKQHASEDQLPIRLSIIKANPLIPFYQKLGFRQYDEDTDFYKFEWHPLDDNAKV